MSMVLLFNSSISRVTVTHNTNAIIKSTLSVTHSTDARILGSGSSRTHDTDAVIINPRIQAADALVKKTTIKVHSTDADIASIAIGLVGMDSFAHQSLAVAQTGSGFAGIYSPNPNGVINPAGISFDLVNKRLSGHVASLKLVEDGITATSVGHHLPAGIQTLIMSFYFRCVTTPTVKSRLAAIVHPVSIGQMGLTSTGLFWYNLAAIGEHTIGSSTFADSQWHRVDVLMDSSGTTFTLDVQVDGVAGPQSQRTGQTPSDLSDVKLGSATTTHTGTFWYQDWVWSKTPSDYPIGMHVVYAVYPNGDVTPNLNGNIVNQAAGTTNLWQSIDDWNGGLPDTATYIAQTATDATAYSEHSFLNTAAAENSVLDAQAVLAGFSSGTGANAAIARIVGSTNFTIDDVGPLDYSGSTTVLGYHTQVLARPADGWTPGKLNGMKLRWGFSTSATVNPRLSAFMVEYCAPTPTTQTPLTFASDALILHPAIKVYSTDAIISAPTRLRSQSVDAIIRKTATHTHSVDAYIATGTRFKTHITDASITSPNSTSDYGEGYASGGYLGEAVTPPPPPGSTPEDRRVILFENLDFTHNSPSQIESLLATLGSGHQIRVRLFVLNASETTSREITNRLITGQVDLDTSRDPSRWCSLDILDPRYQLSITEPSSPVLGGLWAGSMVRVFYDVLVPELNAWVPVPVFTGPVQSYTRDGATVHLQCVGKEAFMLPPNRYDKVAAHTTGATTRQALESLLTGIGEPQKVKWDGPIEKMDKSFDSMREFIGGQNSYLVLAQKIVGSGAAFFYDGYGTPRVALTDVKGVLDLTPYVLTAVSQSFDMGVIRNRARALTSSKPPTSETATIDGGQPFSAGRLGRSGVPRWLDAALPARKYRKKGDAAAAALSLLTKTDEVNVKLDIMPIPFLNERDRVQVTDTGGSVSTFRVTAFSLPLHIGDAMALNYTRKLLDPRNAGARFRRARPKHVK